MWDVCVSLQMQVELTTDSGSLPQSFFTLLEGRTFHWTQNSVFFLEGALWIQNLVLSVLSTEPFPQHTNTAIYKAIPPGPSPNH